MAGGASAPGSELDFPGNLWRAPFAILVQGVNGKDNVLNTKSKTFVCSQPLRRVFQWLSFDENNNHNNSTFISVRLFWETDLLKILFWGFLCLSYFWQFLFWEKLLFWVLLWVLFKSELFLVLFWVNLSYFWVNSLFWALFLAHLLRLSTFFSKTTFLRLSGWLSILDYNSMCSEMVFNPEKSFSSNSKNSRLFLTAAPALSQNCQIAV